MKNNKILKALGPHLLSLLVMIVLTVLFFQPVFNEKKIIQHDIVQWKGMAKEVTDFKEKTGEPALWTNGMFGGMPAYQISLGSTANVLRNIDPVIRSVFPLPAHYMLLMMLGFYILMSTLGAGPWVSLIGAIGYGFTSFFLISIEAGHNNKVHAISYMAPALAGIIIAYRGKYLLGGALTALFLALAVMTNHIQINYYTMILGLMVALAFLIDAIKKQQIPQFVKASAILIVAAVLAIGPSATRLMTTYEYSKDTIRGGKSELSSKKAKTSGGLDWDYATAWSYGKLESMTWIIPNFMGGASTQELSTSSNVAKKGIPKQNLKYVRTYWGDQPFTSGPTYFGALVCFLFILGLFVLKGPLMWGLIAATILSLFLGWGNNFEIFNRLLFEYLPLYNKFRTPAMAFVIAQLCVPLIGFLGLNELLKSDLSKKELLNYLKYAAGISAGIILVFGVAGSFMFDFKAVSDAQLAQMGWPVDAIQADRADLLRTDSFRSLIFIVLAAGLLWAYIENKLKPLYLVAVLGIMILTDLWTVDRRYLNDDDYVSEKVYDKEFLPSQADRSILADTDPNFRVLNLSTDFFNDAKTSYHHKSIGGYHAAKLIRYQDLKEYHLQRHFDELRQILSKQEGASQINTYLANAGVLNMLNMKYIIANPKGNALRNPNALGNAWFVKQVSFVENADQEISALSGLNPAKTAVVDKRYEELLKGLTVNSSAGQKITLTSYKPNHLVYSSETSSEGLAVFSEVYYNSGKGWNAYINGQPVDHIRANYVLRGLRVPAGNNKVEFKFEPQSFKKGETISMISSLILLFGVIGIFGFNIFRFSKESLPS